MSGIKKLWLKDQARKVKIIATSWEKLVGEVLRNYRFSRRNSSSLTTDEHGDTMFLSKIPFRGQFYISGEGGSSTVYFAGTLGGVMTTMKTILDPLCKKGVSDQQ